MIAKGRGKEDEVCACVLVCVCARMNESGMRTESVRKRWLIGSKKEIHLFKSNIKHSESVGQINVLWASPGLINY